MKSLLNPTCLLSGSGRLSSSCIREVARSWFGLAPFANGADNSVCFGDQLSGSGRLSSSCIGDVVRSWFRAAASVVRAGVSALTLAG